ERVHAELRRNGAGSVYGITFIDFRTKCVFNGSDLGKGYSAAAIQQGLMKPSETEKGFSQLLEKRPPAAKGLQNTPPGYTSKEERKDREKSHSTTDALNAGAMLEALLKGEKGEARMPYELLNKKRKRRGLNL